MNNAICGNMDGPRNFILSEVSQAKTNMLYHLYVEPKKMVQINLLTIDSQTL